MHYIITCKEDALRLLHDQSLAYRYKYIELGLTNVPSSNLQKHIDRLNKYYFSCGCNTGATIMLSTAGLGIFILTFFKIWSFGNAFIFLLTMFISGLIGKVLALAYAKRQAKNHLNQVLTLL